MILAVLLILLAWPAEAATLITHSAAGSSDTNNVTTTAANCSGSDFIIMATVFVTGVTVTPSDSTSANTWSTGTSHNSATGATVRTYYVITPTVSATQTFTISSTSGFPAVAVQCWSGMTGGFDQQNAAHTTVNATSFQDTGVTPTIDNEVVFSALLLEADETGNGPTVDLSFNISDTVQFNGANHYGVSLASLIETTATAKNPTWSWTAGTAASASIINNTFKATPASGGAWRSGTMLGVGQQ